MVDLVNDEDITDINDMKEFLRDTPQPRELNEVYIKLFRHRIKGNPKVNITVRDSIFTLPDHFLLTYSMTKLIAIASRSLEILAVSRRPLSVNELAYAVALTGCEEPPTRLRDIEAILSPKRIQQLIEPFVTRYNPEDKTLPQIKLLHRSLLEFILRCSPAEWTNALIPPTSWQAEVPPEVAQRRRANMEAQLLQACATYILLDDINDHSLFSGNEVGFDSLPHSDGLFDDENVEDSEGPEEPEKPVEIATFDPVKEDMGPFFVYAACYWLDHLGKLHDPSPEIIEQVIRLGEPGSTRLHNWADQHCRPECTVSPKFYFAPEELDPLSLATLYGSDDVFCALLRRADRFEGASPLSSGPAPSSAPRS
ncbi:hypothetical protein PG997_006723 [Apiospora hydei]|uniref:Uncharacterized protein n=1 Tax=Apiospora hydei TaxID=1337664 RepID=A0ABR1WPQ8_9PEZI